MYIVCFNGPPRSGKDTMARMLAEHMDSQGVKVPVVEVSLSTPLRRIAYQMIGENYVHDGIGNFSYDAFKEDTFPQFNCTGRQLMIDVSEKFLKPCYGQRIMADMLLAELHELPPYPFDGVVLVRDSGFQCEIEPLVDAVGDSNLYVVNLRRSGCDFSNDSREWVHHEFGGEFYNNEALADLRVTTTVLYERLVHEMGWVL